jgi:hypothetical protein
VIISFFILLLLAISHGPFLARLLSSLRARRMPTTREMVILSFFVYYDLGFLAEISGIPYINPFFPSVFDVNGSTLAVVLTIIVIAPWVLDLPAGIRRKRGVIAPVCESAIRPSLRLYFYPTMSVLCLACLGVSLLFSRQSLHIWSVRNEMSTALGPYVIIVLIPLYVLAFYVKQRDATSIGGSLYLIFLVLCATATAIPLGERTYILMPWIIVMIFWKKITIQNIAIGGIVALVGAALLLPIFKWQSSKTSNAPDLLMSALNNDVARAPILADVVRKSEWVGTSTLSYSGEGYIYSALLFIPRSVAPFKGYSTAVYYTAHISDNSPEAMGWGLGISAIDELLLNFGFLFLPLGLVLCGVVICFADYASATIPALIVPTRLAALFLLGYHLPALMQSFGAMAILACVLNFIFASRTKPLVSERRGASPVRCYQVSIPASATGRT